VEVLDFTLTGETTMTEDRLPRNEPLQRAGDGDFLRAVAESVLQLLMEADVEGLIDAGRHERAADRLNWRNGYRDRTLDTRLGSLIRGLGPHSRITGLLLFPLSPSRGNCLSATTGFRFQ
jgi:hypothetical protein